MNEIHPLAWWVWGLATAAAAASTTNVVLLAGFVAAVSFVVASGESRGFRVYLALAAAVLVVRIAARLLIGVGGSGTVLFTLPSWEPFGGAGVRFGGAVTVDALRSGIGDAARLATLLVAIGGANAVADPKRLLRAVPAAWGHIGTAMLVAVNVTPQLADSARRVAAARRLRAEPHRRMLRDLITPVMVDALDRSLALAVAMECRGYGRRRAMDSRSRWIGAVAVIGGLVAVAGGTFAALTRTGTPRSIGSAAQILGSAVALLGAVLSAQRSRVTRYRPDRFGARSVLVAGCGATAAVLAMQLDAATSHPLGWPTLSPAALLAIVAVALPVVVRP